MKRRIRKVANFFAFNLLFFALYLNFIHKDNSAIVNDEQADQPKTAAFSVSVPLENPEQYMQKKNQATASINTPEVAPQKVEQAEVTALKLSIN